jgi:multidrug efflux pump
LFIIVLGSVAVTRLPIAQYPPSPPAIVVCNLPRRFCAGAEDSVLSVIEREMNGSPGLIYIETVSQANGTGTITLSFEPGTNRLGPSRRSKSFGSGHSLPQSVVQQGVRVDKSNAGFLLCYFVVRQSAIDPIALGDFAARNIVPRFSVSWDWPSPGFEYQRAMQSGSTQPS